jgi:hypothetical protein
MCKRGGSSVIAGSASTGLSAAARACDSRPRAPSFVRPAEGDRSSIADVNATGPRANVPARAPGPRRALRGLRLSGQSPCLVMRGYQFTSEASGFIHDRHLNQTGRVSERHAARLGGDTFNEGYERALVSLNAIPGLPGSYSSLPIPLVRAPGATAAAYSKNAATATRSGRSGFSPMLNSYDRVSGTDRIRPRAVKRDLRQTDARSAAVGARAVCTGSPHYRAGRRARRGR